MIISKTFFAWLRMWLGVPTSILLSLMVITGQSGKVVPSVKSPDKRTLGQEDEGRGKPKGLVIDPKTSKYKLLFAPNYDGKLSFLMTEVSERKRSRMSSYNNFVEQLNSAGGEGYKTVSTINGDVAIAKFDEGRFEYDWFETVGSVHFAKSGLRAKLKEMWVKGFRLIDHSLVSKYCELTNYEFSTNYEVCEYIDFFLTEKEKDEKKSIEQDIFNTLPGWSARPSFEMTAEIDKMLAEGFYPVRAVSQFEILLEKVKNKDAILDDKPEVQVVRSETKGLQKKVNELAKQGYRLALTNYRVAAMYRNSETAGNPVSYVWIRADRKNFEKELAKLQQKGARYHTTYPNDKGTKNTLIFEQNLSNKTGLAEFKVLEFDFDEREDKNAGKVYVKLTPLAEASIKTMNELAKQGFVVRDLFDGDKVSVILERVR